MKSVVLMGVAGCGKSSVGRLLAQKLAVTLIEGDEFHPLCNQEKMRQGIALTDADRAAWLTRLGFELSQHPLGAVLTCSALKRSYRDRLRSMVQGLRFVYLEIDQATAHQRVSARAAGHLFPPELVPSQFAALEPPLGESGVLRVDATRELTKLTDEIVRWLQKSS